MLPEKASVPQEIANADIPQEVSALEWDDDDALIHWMLGLSPSERLAVADGMLQLAEVARRGRRP